jgi:hypothetical protein
MLEKKECIMCKFEVIILNCHYTCKNCGFSENCHDIPHLIHQENKKKSK